MQFHPFNLKLVRANKETQQVEVFDSLKDAKISDFFTESHWEEKLNEDNFPTRSIVSTKTTAKMLLTTETAKGTVYHGDVFFNLERLEFCVFTFAKCTNYLNGVSHHGFFHLDTIRHKNVHNLGLLNLYDSVSIFNKKESDYVYVCNLFLHEVEVANAKLKETDNFGRKRNIKVSRLLRNQKFMESSSITLFYCDDDTKQTIKHVYYDEGNLNKDLVICKDEDWDLFITNKVNFYHTDLRTTYDNPYLVKTGVLYEMNMDKDIYRYLERKLKGTDFYDLNCSMESLTYYKEFFLEYTHEGLWVHAFTSQGYQYFKFSDIPFVCQFNGMFDMIHSKENNRFTKRYLSLI